MLCSARTTANEPRLIPSPRPDLLAYNPKQTLDAAIRAGIPSACMPLDRCTCIAHSNAVAGLKLLWNWQYLLDRERDL